MVRSRSTNRLFSSTYKKLCVIELTMRTLKILSIIFNQLQLHCSCLSSTFHACMRAIDANMVIDPSTAIGNFSKKTGCSSFSEIICVPVAVTEEYRFWLIHVQA